MWDQKHKTCAVRWDEFLRGEGDLILSKRRLQAPRSSTHEHEGEKNLAVEREKCARDGYL